MSAQAVIDSLGFAQAAREMSGSLPIGSLARLSDHLHGNTTGCLHFRLKGGSDEQGRPVLHIEINGMLNLQCQRCLELLEYPLQLSNTLRLLEPVEGVGQETDDPESPDCIEALAELDVTDLVEDEVLLGLPYAPRHEDRGCREISSTGHKTGGSAAFAKLAELKTNYGINE